MNFRDYGNREIFAREIIVAPCGFPDSKYCHDNYRDYKHCRCVIIYSPIPISDALNSVMHRPFRRLLKDPGDVSRIVAVDGDVVAAERVVLGPEEQPHVLDAVLRQPRRVRQGAKRKIDLGSVL